MPNTRLLRLPDKNKHTTIKLSLTFLSSTATTSIPNDVLLPLLLLVLGVVVPGRPARVQPHVRLSLLARQLVVLGLVLSGQRVPLKTDVDISRVW